MKLYHWILDVLYPPKCILCGRLLGREETDLCGSCRLEAPAFHQAKSKLQFLDSFTATWYYEGYVRRSLLRYKFQGCRSYAPAYGRLLAMKLVQAHPEGFDGITWVPLSPLGRLRRGYDQVELLARALGRELGMEPAPLLKKIRSNRRQSRVTGSAQRRANVLGVYAVTDPEALRGKRILLVDDILTTGATASECARMLLTAGAKEVHCAVLGAAPSI